MTPETIQALGTLREDFYKRFQKALRKSLNLEKKNALIFNPSFQSVASWVDDKGRMNFISVYAHQAPDALFPDHNLVLRISLNCRADRSLEANRPAGSKFNRDWSLELTLLPEEALDFAPWIVSWVAAQDNPTLALKSPPYPVESSQSFTAGCDRLWTEAAWKSITLDTPKVRRNDLAPLFSMAA
ncbi:MAG: hypothetical protein WCD18_05105 [Thermosynechococcaceae cyanobacterium]